MDNHGKENASAMAGKHPPRVELSIKELEAILEHARSALSKREFAVLKGVLQTLEFLTRELEKKSVSIQRLRQMLFGAATETTAKVFKKILDDAVKGQAAVNAGVASEGTQASAGEKPKGHGRNGADAYSGG